MSNIQQLEVVARGSETQLQAVENFNELSNELYNYIVLAAQGLK